MNTDRDTLEYTHVPILALSLYAGLGVLDPSVLLIQRRRGISKDGCGRQDRKNSANTRRWWRLPSVRHFHLHCNHLSQLTSIYAISHVEEINIEQRHIIHNTIHHLPTVTTISISGITITIKLIITNGEDNSIMASIDHLLSHLTIHVSGLPTVSRPLELFYPQHRLYHQDSHHTVRVMSAGERHGLIMDKDIVSHWRLPSVVAAYEVYF
jgi:hypothetical protein